MAINQLYFTPNLKTNKMAGLFARRDLTEIEKCTILAFDLFFRGQQFEIDFHDGSKRVGTCPSLLPFRHILELFDPMGSFFVLLQKQERNTR